MSSTLSKKIFIFTSVFLVGFIALTLIFQTFIFEDFYEKKKTTSLIDAIEKFASKNIFFSSSEWEKIRNQFKLEYFTEIHRQKPRFTRPSHDEVSMLLFRHL
ncbi:MAG: hypothetical protein E6789_06410 [Clostridium baratii]|nr:hypothetical protein [Clostridium baratii]